MANSAMGYYRGKNVVVPIYKTLKSGPRRKDFKWGTICKNHRAVYNEGLNMVTQTKV